MPDCDTFTTMPLPTGGAIEGQTGYTCDTSQNDCHLLVVYPPTNTLYEIYQATSQGSGIVGGCGVLWDLTKAYPDNLRGDQCTSADAAGFPLSAMLPDADEVASGACQARGPFPRSAQCQHERGGLRPSGDARGRARRRKRPAALRRTPASARRLPRVELALGAAQVLAVALQKYGMFLSDGGNIPLMVQSDQFTTHKWANLDFDTHMLFGLSPTDFEVVDLPSPTTLTYACVRNP